MLFPSVVRVALMVVILSICVLRMSEGATYYLHPATGSDANPGTLAQPWKTLFKVKTAPGVGAGTIINILAGTYTQSQVACEGGTPNWTHAQNRGTTGNPLIIQANPGSTVVFDGQGTSYWQRFYVTGSYSGHYIVVQNLTFQNYRAAVVGVQGASIATPTSYVAVVNCLFRNIVQEQSAPLFALNAEHVLFVGNTVLNVGGPGQSSAGDGSPQNEHGIYMADQSRYVVADQNKLEKISGFGFHLWNAHSISNTSSNVIVRRNTVMNTHSSGLIMAGDTYNKIYVFNNTFYNEAVPFPAIDGNAGNGALTFHNGGTFSNITIKNNIGYGTWAISAFSQEYSVGLFTNLVNDYNLWTNLQTSSRTIQWSGAYYTLAAYQAAISRETHSLTGNPLFTSASARDFTLATGSPAIDAGQVLTTAVGSGSGTTLTVADAGYFHDGYGLTTGDTIQIGGTASVVVTSVNYSTNVLTLASSRTWSSGDGVSLPYFGSRPDMGALESGSAQASLPAPTNLRLQ